MLVKGAVADSPPSQITQPALHVRGLDLGRGLSVCSKDERSVSCLSPQQVFAALALGGRGRRSERDGAAKGNPQIHLDGREGWWEGFSIDFPILAIRAHN